MTMSLSEDERSIGVAVVVREMIAQGATPEAIDAYYANVESPDEDDEEPAESTEPQAVAAEQWSVVLESEPLIQDIPIPGEHRDVEAELVDMMLEAQGIRTELPQRLDSLPIPD